MYFVVDVFHYLGPRIDHLRTARVYANQCSLIKLHWCSLLPR